MVDAAAAPLKSEGFGASLRLAGNAVRAQIGAWAQAETARTGLWTPVALGAGAVWYFQLASEPSPFIAPALLIALIFIGWQRAEIRTIALMAGFVCAGFLFADLRTFLVAAPAIEREIKFADVEGRLIAIDEAPRLRRLIVEVGSIGELTDNETPERIRVTWRGKEFDARPGDLVRFRASLSPPPSPAAPGGFDFARQLYFQRIGAVGFAVSPPTQVAEPDRPLFSEISAAIESLRVGLSRRILAKAPGDGGAIVAAVVSGKRGAITEEAEAAFRDSGLAHLLSISGLHMGLATGLIFFAVRAILATIEPVALTKPIKKWAAASALISGFAYLLVSGAAWPAQRAFIMSSIFFIAIIADRRALSLRNVAIAAFVIIALTPEAVLHPGFQMSFAAVTALIAYYEWASARTNPARSFSIGARVGRYAFGVAATDIISSLATAPYSLYHFSRTANFGLLANSISIPIMGFWVMPAAIVAIAFIPLGADGLFWQIAAAGVEIMLAVGRWTMELPGAVTVFPHWPTSALVVLTIGGLWICLMSAQWRLGGVLALPIAAALIAAEPQPRIFVSEDGDNAGFLFGAPKGERAFAVFDRRRGKFDSGVWMEQSGLDTQRVRPAQLSEHAACDRRGCVVLIANRHVAVSSRAAGLKEDCERADLVVALYPVADRDRRGCDAALIDRRDAWSDGAHAVYISQKGLKISNAAQMRGARPWTMR